MLLKLQCCQVRQAACCKSRFWHTGVFSDFARVKSEFKNKSTVQEGNLPSSSPTLSKLEVELNLVGYTCDMVDTVVSVDNDTITKRRRGAYSESATLFFGTGEQGSDPTFHQSNLISAQDLRPAGQRLCFVDFNFGVVPRCQDTVPNLPDLHMVEQLNQNQQKVISDMVV